MRSCGFVEKGEGSGGKCVRTVEKDKEIDVVWDGVVTAAGAAGDGVTGAGGVGEVVEDKVRVVVAVRIAVMGNIVVVVVFLNKRRVALKDDWGERKMVEHRMVASGRGELPPQSWRAPHISVSYPSQFPPFTSPTLQQWSTNLRFPRQDFS